MPSRHLQIIFCDKAPSHWLILKTAIHRDTVAFPTGTRVGGDSQLTEGLAKGPYLGYLEIWGIPRDIYVIVHLYLLCVFSTRYLGNKLDLWQAWFKLLNTIQVTLPPWGDSRMSHMRTRPSSEELAKILSFTGLTDKPYTASSWANTSKVSLLRENAENI